MLPKTIKNPIEREPIEKALELVASIFAKRNIPTDFQILNIPEVKRDDDSFIEFLRMRGKIVYRKTELDLTFHVPIPIDTHRTEKDWSWIIAYNFVGQVFADLKNAHSLESALEFWKHGMDIVDKLIRA